MTAMPPEGRNLPVKAETDQLPATQVAAELAAQGPRPPTAGRNDLLEFMPDIVAIERRPVPKAAEITLLAVIGLIVAAVTWASWAKIDRFVTTRGKLVTTSSKIMVQPIETGVIRTVEARVGQVVKKGDILATLDATFADADVTASRGAYISLAAQVARLEAELEGQKPASFSEDATEDALQREIFSKRRSEYQAQSLALEAEIRELTAQARTNRREQSDLKDQTRVMKELEDMRLTSMKKQIGSRLLWLEARTQRMVAEREMHRVINRADEIRHKLATLEAKRDAFIHEHQSGIAQELVKARRERDRMAEDLKKQERRSSLVQLVAPDDAVVLDIAQRSVGSVIRQAEPFITMVPVDVPLEVEVDIRPQDIAHLRPGDPVRIKLEAMPYQRYGTLDGELVVISEDTFKIQKGAAEQAVYRGRIAVTQWHLRNVPDDFRLIPGMSLSAEIKVGERRLISYFLYPIFRALDSSFREP